MVHEPQKQKRVPNSIWLRKERTHHNANKNDHCSEKSVNGRRTYEGRIGCNARNHQHHRPEYCTNNPQNGPRVDDRESRRRRPQNRSFPSRTLIASRGLLSCMRGPSESNNATLPQIEPATHTILGAQIPKADEMSANSRVKMKWSRESREKVASRLRTLGIIINLISGIGFEQEGRRESRE